MLTKNWKIKISDFYLATKVQFEGERKTEMCCTPNYVAPEVLNCRKTGRGYSYEVDIWAIGVIIYALLIGKPPFERRNIKETFRRIRNVNYNFPTKISIPAKDLITKILKKDPNDRPNLSEIIAHPFVKQLTATKSMPIKSP